MEKKYRLKIPKNIRCAVKDELCILDDTIIKDSGVWNYNDEMFKESCYIPKDWLEEIKQPEILTAEESAGINKFYRDEIGYEQYLWGFEEGDKNGQLKLWHGGGIGELVDAVKEFFAEDNSKGCDDVLEALEKIQKPE